MRRAILAVFAILAVGGLLGSCAGQKSAAPDCRKLSEHFCQEELPPHDGAMRSIWGSSATDIWAGGDEGLLLHYDGTSWSSVPSGTTDPLVALWGTAPDDIWAVGEAGADQVAIRSYARTILHYDGRAWMPVWHGVTGPHVNTRISGTGPTDIWVDGSPPLHYDGTAWTAFPPGSPSTVCHFWAWAVDDVWRGCNSSPGWSLAHFDGTGWIDSSVPSAAGINSILGFWGSASDDIWAASDTSKLLHYDGTAWKLEELPQYTFIRTFWGSGPKDLWGLGFSSLLHYDGSTWSKADPGFSTYLYGLWGSGPNDIWAVGDNGVIIHYDGTRWSLARNSPWPNVSISDMGGSGPDDRWLLGLVQMLPVQGVVGHHDGRAWSSQALTGLSNPEQYRQLLAIWSSGQNNLFVGGSKDNLPLLLHRRTDWSEVPLPAGTQGTVVALWGSGPDDLWVATESSSPSKATLLHRTGTIWSVMPASPLTSICCIWGSGPKDVWFGGPRTTPTVTGGMLHYDGQGLTFVDLRLGVDSISGSGADDVWATAGLTTQIGDGHLPKSIVEEYLLHYDGKAWMKVSEPTLQRRRGTRVHSTRRGDVWILQDGIEHLEGGSWVHYDPKVSGLNRIWGIDPQHVWFFGGSTIVRYVPAAIAPLLPPVPPI